MPNQLFISRKRKGYVPEAGKQAITGDFLLSGNQDDSDFHKWNARRLVNTMYGMLKNHTEYREPEE